MWELAKSKRIWVAGLCASAYATIPFVLFPAYFFLIIFALRSAQERAISYLDAPLYGAQLALRVLSAIALAGALHLDFSSVLSDCAATAALAIQARETFDPCLHANVDLTNLVRILVCCGLLWIWIKHDRRPLTATHFGSAAIVAFAALMLNAALTPKPGSLADGWPPPLVWDRLGLTSIVVSYAEITLQVLIVAGLGFLLGHLCAPCFGQPNAPPKRILFSFMPHANWFRADRLTWRQILAGFLAATTLTVLFTAKNSAIYSEYPLDWRYAYNDNLIGRFNFDALSAGLSGALEAAPYIAAGAIIIWLLGQLRFAGIFPILVVGAIMGRIAGVMIQPSYQTPFLTPLDSATLIGMIIAAGFGVAANATGLRTNQDKIDTTSNQPI